MVLTLSREARRVDIGREPGGGGGRPAHSAERERWLGRGGSSGDQGGGGLLTGFSCRRPTCESFPLTHRM